MYRKTGESDKEQRNIRDKSARYELKDGQLFFKRIDKVMGERLVRVVQKEEEKSILERAHCGVYASHFQRDKTYSKVYSALSTVLIADLQSFPYSS